MQEKCHKKIELFLTYFDCINCELIPVPEMDGRQMRLISYSGDQKLLQIR